MLLDKLIIGMSFGFEEWMGVRKMSRGETL